MTPDIVTSAVYSGVRSEPGAQQVALARGTPVDASLGLVDDLRGDRRDLDVAPIALRGARPAPLIALVVAATAVAIAGFVLPGARD
jgi:hypothetical protein